MKDNKLIAEFMGGVLSSVPNLINLPQTRGDANIHSVKGSEVLPNGTYSVHRLSELKYHTSWNWLMPVVEKIEGLRDSKGDAYRFSIDMCNAQIEGANIEILGGAFKLDTTYKAVVEFINQLKTK